MLSNWFKPKRPAVEPDLSSPTSRSKQKRWLAWTLLLLMVVIIVITGVFFAATPSEAVMKIVRSDAFFLAISILAILSGAIFLWFVPQWQTATINELTPETRFDKENEARKTLAQILGGLLVIGTLFLTVKTLQVSQDQAAASAKQAAIAAEQMQLAREAQITDRFTKAIDQLGNIEKQEIRLGGIYSLERLARESPEDHWQIVEILTTYVREHAPLQRQNGVKGKLVKGARAAVPGLRADIQAILTVLGRRDSKGELYRMNLAAVDISGAELGEADFREVDLTGSYLVEAQLVGTRFNDALLTSADLSRADLSSANLSKAALSGARLSSALLVGARLKEARLDGVDLSNAKLDNVDLTGAQLSEAHLDGAQLIGAHLVGADLSRTSFRGADLSGADLGDAELDGADFREADLTGASSITQTQINKVKGDLKTKLPRGVARPKSWK